MSNPDGILGSWLWAGQRGHGGVPLDRKISVCACVCAAPSSAFQINLLKIMMVREEFMFLGEPFRDVYILEEICFSYDVFLLIIL